MSTSTKLTGAMRSASLPVSGGRPWTPPEMDSDCFPDAFARSSTPPPGVEERAIPSPRLPAESTEPTSRPKPVSRATGPIHRENTLEGSDDQGTPGYFRRLDSYPSPSLSGLTDAPALDTRPYAMDPYTPVKTPWASQILQDNGLPQYPYTPESVRTTKSHVFRPLSPPPSMPWDSDSDARSSPIQHALSACVAQLENLIQTREPTDEQMEYLVSRFEEMAQFLSAPEAQSKQTDDHLFSELEQPSDATGLGIVNDKVANHPHQDAEDLAMSQGYILGVERFIEGVKTYMQDMAMRMEEVKQLNSIQLEIIDDLRRELKLKTAQLKQEEEEHVQKPSNIKTIVPPRNGFWFAVAEALDRVGEMLHEW